MKLKNIFEKAANVGLYGCDVLFNLAVVNKAMEEKGYQFEIQTIHAPIAYSRGGAGNASFTNIYKNGEYIAPLSPEMRAYRKERAQTRAVVFGFNK
jgi:hypothetical protein